MTLIVTVYGFTPLGIAPVKLAWPWYVMVGGGANVIATLMASRILDGYKAGWHEYSVPGQRQRFTREGLPEKQDGWYVVPGRIDRSVWGLLVWFVLIVLFLAYFGTLG